ncbi:hypothetical protein H2198_007402 [Neophaeococcomyces mojaviensis]|uniref:Uncharacterized protein n=1 Tax=Neophaeococcomyces mojaviensis TaxID=3383035 RepID=A0ACC3A024_9EURO|nr:hypothetical protein H2198_007402 [Knufia sp. JES_112]
MTEQTSRFLAIPLEIRQVVYSEIFDTRAGIAIEAAPRLAPSPGGEPTTTSWSAEDEFWAIKPHQLSSQFLRTCRQIHTEALPHLYSLRIFDVTARESLQLFLHNIGPQNFAFIHHIVIDWDFLQDLGWSLTKDEYKLATSGLNNIEVKSWRMRHLTGTSVQWRNVKSHERSLCQAALDICKKHKQLKVLAESYHRRASSSAGISLSGIAGGGVPATRSNCRVKWRFVTCLEELREDETVVDIEKDIDLLRATKEEAREGGFSLPMIDPF